MEHNLTIGSLVIVVAIAFITPIFRIYRNAIPITPHGDTSILVNDRILVSGSLESIKSLQNRLS
ncbi:hypothetical protein MFMK1_000542 [Metallumcola ferriviriculae]|uniref:Uncharacterized protein n=1 Tax=Metallumcola ferriviriculae TaxID=3039180 RepID=A0AAU0UKJ9_9FIRM|nr:hypothetical protein MFMK1_000542 [Desulfitibacteraceae bacterium MK1]